jgi:peptidoglycan/LPS O-acetylase OafA/YrhL
VVWQGEVALQKLLIPLVIVGTVVRPKGIPGRILEFPPIRWVGRLSYSLYLWQQLFLVTNAERAERMGSLQSFPINIVCVLAIATASYYLVERPLIKIGHRLAKPVTPGRPDLRETPTIPAIIAATTPVITAAPASSETGGQVATT